MCFCWFCVNFVALVALIEVVWKDPFRGLSKSELCGAQARKLVYSSVAVDLDIVLYFILRTN